MPENVTGNPYEEYIFIKTANATGYTVEQVRTITLLERETDRSYEAECRRVRRGDSPCWPQRDGIGFKVEHDERLGLPRVDYVDMSGWHETGVAVLKDGKLDRSP
jgi:hypothetical protein